MLQSSDSVLSNVRSSYQINCLVRDFFPPPHDFEQSVQDDQFNHAPQAETGQDTHATAGSIEQRSAERWLTLSDVQTQRSNGSSSNASRESSIEFNDSLIRLNRDGIEFTKSIKSGIWLSIFSRISI